MSELLDKITELESQLQKANFERNRILEVIEREDELGLMRRIIDKVHSMVALRTHEDFDEGE